MRPLRATLVVGRGPNFIKASALLPPLKAEGFRVRLVHTGQHYDRGMSEVFFRQLGLPRPDLNLEVGPGSPSRQTALILEGMEDDLAAHPPDVLVVMGDVTSTAAAALAASKRRTSLAHVEAGMRSFDRTMPEEVNRIVTDHLSDLLFTTAAEDDLNLRREGIPPARIRRAGNVMVDTLLKHRRVARAAGRTALDRFRLGGRYGIATLHRPENVDCPERLERLVEGLGRVARRLSLLFPVHPRTRRLLDGLSLPPGLRLCPPLGYLEFLGLMGRAALVLTDSGGVQMESSVLGVPCLTLRDSTEWPVTCRAGTNRLVGTDPVALDRWAGRFLSRPPKGRKLPLWDGRAGTRVARGLKAWLGR